LKRILLLGALLAVAVATVGAERAAAAAPTLTGFAPASGPAAWSVTLSGTDFSGATTVTFTPTDPSYPGQQATFTVKNDTTIVASVPFFATVPLEATLTVGTPDGPATSAGDFGLDGQLALSEHKGSSDEPLTLTGSGFTGATRVVFGTWRWPLQGDEAFSLLNPKAAKYRVLSDTTISATVPALRAGSHYWVEVVSPTSTSVSTYSSPFRVIRPHLLRQTYSSSFAIRPATVIPSGDGALLIGNLYKHRGHAIRWRTWSARAAYGVGIVWIDDGIPNEALGTFIGYRGSISVSRVRGGLFTRMTIRWLQSTGHEHRMFLKLSKVGAGPWFWRS
jgi:hypothetical protein